MIQFIQVEKSFSEGGRRRIIFDGLDFQIEQKQFIAVKGPSGSGKSTFLNLTAGLEKPDSGQILINKQVISKFSDAAAATFRRLNIGFIFQSYNLIPYLSVFDNIYLPVELNGVSVSKDQVLAVMDELGIAELKDQFPDSLSGGEQQRTAIARAIIHRPPLILADEPTGNLDEPAALKVLELLRALPEKTGSTIVMVTHSETASSYADQTFHFSHHQLIAQGE